MSILLLGHGYVSQYFCQKFAGQSKEIAASIHKNKDKYLPTSEAIATVNFNDINDNYLERFDNFIVTIPPFYELKTDVVIENFHSYFSSRNKSFKLIYLSATSVYGDHEGKEVQEDSALKSTSSNGLARIACEEKYMQLQKNKAANIIILRLAGIYGDDRNNILRIKNHEVTRNRESKKLISRTHITDIVNIIKSTLDNQAIVNEIFNVADDNPATTKEVNDYICTEILKITPLPINDQQNLSKNSSFMLDNKIVSNQKLKKVLNYKFIYPSYKEGMQQIVKNLNLI